MKYVFHVITLVINVGTDTVWKISRKIYRYRYYVENVFKYKCRYIFYNYLSIDTDRYTIDTDIQ